MPINPHPPGIHHIAFRCMDMAVTKNFCQKIIGLPLAIDTPDLIIFAAGSVFVALKQANPRDKNYASFSPFEVGLDHIAAMACETEEELHRFAKGLADA